MPSSWLSPLSSATRRSSWFEVNAPQQSATPAPTDQVQVPMTFATVNDEPVDVNPDAPTSGAPSWLAPLGQTAPLAAPAAPGSTSGTGLDDDPWRARPAPSGAVQAASAASSTQAPAWLETLNAVLESPVRAAAGALPRAAGVLADTWKLGLGIDPRRSVLDEVGQLGHALTAPQTGMVAGFRALQEGAPALEVVRRALRAAREQGQGIPGEPPSDWLRSRGVDLYPNLPEPLSNLATDVTLDPLNAVDALKGVSVLFGMAPLVSRGLKLGDAVRQAGQAGRRVIEIRSPLVDADWGARFVKEATAAGWDERTIRSTADTIQGLANLFEAHPGVLPQSGLIGEAFRPNQDFIWTLDIDRNCARVRKYWATVEAVQQQLKRPMTPDELLALGQEMRRVGDIPGCVFCYVEAGRRFRQELAHRITSLPADEAARQFPPRDEKDKFLEWIARRNALLTEVGWMPTHATPEQEQAALARFAEAAAVPAARQQVEQAPAGRQLMQTYDKYIGGANASQYAGHAIYGNEILNKRQATIDLLNRRAGLRHWSATDLDPTAMLESVKAMAHATIRGLMGHAYTKEPYAVEIFGKTGMKLNLSVAVQRDAAGKMVSDAYNGMPLDVALKLRRKYENAGTMLVAKDLDQIRWGLDQAQIDMMIPHHAGNWLGGVEKYGAFGLDDFSKVQHEVWLDRFWPDGTPKGDLDKWADGRLEFKHWLIKAKYDPRRAAQLYLDFCKKNGIRPKFAKGTFQNHLTGGTDTFPGFTDHPNYYKLLTDYARPETPQTALDVTKVDKKRMVEYVDRFVGGGGWTPGEQPDPATVTRTLDLLTSGQPIDLAARERALGAPADPNAVNLVPLRLTRKDGSPVPGVGTTGPSTTGSAPTPPSKPAPAARSARSAPVQSPIVYHGTDRRFSTFGDDSWFTSDPKNATFYGDRVIPARVTLKNPLIVTPEMHRAPEHAHHSPAWWAKKAKADGHDGVILRDVVDGYKISDVYGVFNSTQAKRAGKTLSVDEVYR